MDLSRSGKGVAGELFKMIYFFPKSASRPSFFFLTKIKVVLYTQKIKEPTWLQRRSHWSVINSAPSESHFGSLLDEMQSVCMLVHMHSNCMSSHIDGFWLPWVVAVWVVMLDKKQKKKKKTNE